MRSVFVGRPDAPGAADADIVAQRLGDLAVARDGEWLVVGLADAAAGREASAGVTPSAGG